MEVVISTNDSKSSGLICSVASPNTREKPSGAGSSVSASTSISSSSTPSDHGGVEPNRLRSIGYFPRTPWTGRPAASHA